MWGRSIRPLIIPVFSILLLVPGVLHAEAFLVVSVKPAEHEQEPRWLGLLDLAKPKQAADRVKHLEIKQQPTLIALEPGLYEIDHFDYTETIAGDERTIRLQPRPAFEIEAGVVRYIGDIFPADARIRLIGSWGTVDELCRTHPAALSRLKLQMGAPGEPVRTITDVCDSLNL